MSASETQGRTRNIRDNNPGVAGCVVVSVPVIGGVSTAGTGGLNLEKTDSATQALWSLLLFESTLGAGSGLSCLAMTRIAVA